MTLLIALLFAAALLLLMFGMARLRLKCHFCGKDIISGQAIYSDGELYCSYRCRDIQNSEGFNG